MDMECVSNFDRVGDGFAVGVGKVSDHVSVTDSVWSIDPDRVGFLDRLSDMDVMLYDAPVCVLVTVTSVEKDWVEDLEKERVRWLVIVRVRLPVLKVDDAVSRLVGVRVLVMDHVRSVVSVRVLVDEGSLLFERVCVGGGLFVKVMDASLDRVCVGGGVTVRGWLMEGDSDAVTSIVSDFVSVSAVPLRSAVPVSE